MKKHLEYLKAINYLQTNQSIIEDLQHEFNSLLNDDKDFNYSKDEFLEWVEDTVMNN